MDKRSLSAIVLTFMVLLAWQMLFVAPRQREMQRQRDEQIRARTAEDSLAALAHEDESVDAPEQVPVAEPAVTRETEDLSSVAGEGGRALSVTVSTGKLEAELNSEGGEIRSVRLLDFVRKDGTFVELVPPGSEGGYALSLLSGDRWQRLSGTGFDVTIDGLPADRETDVLLGGDRQEVTVTFTREGASGEFIEKSFLFRRDGYEVGLHVAIRREGELRASEAYAIGWECGLAVTEADAKGDVRQFASLGMVGEEFYKESTGKFGKETRKTQQGMVRWAGSRTKYFLSALIPERQREATLAMQGNRSDHFVGYGIEYAFRGDPRLVEDDYTCYLGPLDMKTLKEYGIGIEKAIDLGYLRFFSVFILNAMMAMRKVIPNYGVIIIILSVVTKVLFYRLTHKSLKSMKDMQRLQPKIKELQERYRDNKERLNQEMMKLYKEAGVNPLGGCLPLLLQMPVFIALYNVLRNTIELRGAPFALWMDDLSSPDVLFGFGTSLPFLGSEFHLLPILMGAAMVFQSKLTGSPTGEAAPAAQTKMMSTMMPIIFTVIFYGMPSGLVLYWLVNNVLSIVQQYYVHKEVEKEDGETQGGTPPEKNTPGSNTVVSRATENERAAARTGREKLVRGGRDKSRKSKRRTYH